MFGVILVPSETDRDLFLVKKDVLPFTVGISMSIIGWSVGGNIFY